LRKKWGLEDDTVVFAFSGKFIEKKRPMDFVRAILLATQRFSRIQGLMVGDGPLRTACQEFTRNHDAPVRFAGFLNQSEIPSAYAACDVLVLPSDGGETWGLVVNEAMACGRPAIVSDKVGCGPDLIIPEQTGARFPLGDIDALVKAMLDMAKDPGRLSAMGMEASKKIQDYSVPAAVEGMVRCVAATLNRSVIHANPV
jgi:glycosyltransferase involved in cell wall biosynthesis